MADYRPTWFVSHIGAPESHRDTVIYDHGYGWLQGFHGATLGKLTSVAFYSNHDSTDDLEEFEGVASTTSILTTLGHRSCPVDDDNILYCR